jgi:hypothetical protein
LIYVEQAKVDEAMRHEYAQGVARGFKCALQLFLGEIPAGLPPNIGVCPQPLPEDAERWARDALARGQERGVA